MAAVLADLVGLSTTSGKTAKASSRLELSQKGIWPGSLASTLAGEIETFLDRRPG
jgi:hypothetical protein